MRKTSDTTFSHLQSEVFYLFLLFERQSIQNFFSGLLSENEHILFSISTIENKESLKNSFESHGEVKRGSKECNNKTGIY